MIKADAHTLQAMVGLLNDAYGKKFIEWLDQSLIEERSNDYIKDDALLRINQGRRQCLSEILDVINTAKDRLAAKKGGG